MIVLECLILDYRSRRSISTKVFCAISAYTYNMLRHGDDSGGSLLGSPTIVPADGVQAGGSPHSFISTTEDKDDEIAE